MQTKTVKDPFPSTIYDMMKHIFIPTLGGITSFVSGYSSSGEVPIFGQHSILPKEHGAQFFQLPIMRHLAEEVGAVATWDSSIHDSTYLNTVTTGNN